MLKTTAMISQSNTHLIKNDWKKKNTAMPMKCWP